MNNNPVGDSEQSRLQENLVGELKQGRPQETFPQKLSVPVLSNEEDLGRKESEEALPSSGKGLCPSHVRIIKLLKNYKSRDLAAVGYW